MTHFLAYLAGLLTIPAAMAVHLLWDRFYEWRVICTRCGIPYNPFWIIRHRARVCTAERKGRS